VCNNWKIDLSDFEKEQKMYVRFLWRICDKNCTLFGVSRATVPKVMSAYTNHGKTASAMRNGGRKSTLIE
jgi:hypothetical protein